MHSTNERRRTPAPSGGALVTKQSHKSECDINNILSQFKKTGIITHISNSKPNYSDLPDNIDYQTSLNLLIQADDAFSQLPSVVRRYFNNSPAELLQALSDPDQHDKLVEYGILNPKPTPQPPGNPDNAIPLTGDPKLP
jgi:phage internal scaffolding protein